MPMIGMSQEDLTLLSSLRLFQLTLSDSQLVERLVLKFVITTLTSAHRGHTQEVMKPHHLPLEEKVMSL